MNNGTQIIKERKAIKESNDTQIIKEIIKTIKESARLLQTCN